MNEVLYLFEQVEADVIVFEDMDRFDSNEIFVFGSNKSGLHLGGAAAFALENFGAKIEISDEKYQRHWIQAGLGVRDFVKELNLDLEVEHMRDLKKIHFKCEKF